MYEANFFTYYSKYKVNYLVRLSNKVSTNKDSYKSDF